MALQTAPSFKYLLNLITYYFQILISIAIFNIAKTFTPIFYGIIKTIKYHLHCCATKHWFVFTITVITKYRLIIVFSAAVLRFAINSHSFYKTISQFVNLLFILGYFSCHMFTITRHSITPLQILFVLRNLLIISPQQISHFQVYKMYLL